MCRGENEHLAGAEPRISRHCVLFLSLSFLRFGFPFFVVSFPFFSRSRLPLLFLSRHFVGRAASHGKWITRRRSRDEALTNSFYRALLGFIDFHVRSTNFTGFYWVLLGFIGFYWVLLGFTGFYWVFREGSDQLAELVTRKIGCCGPNELIILASLDFLQCLIIHFFFDSTTNIENDDNQPDYLYSFYSVAFIHIH